MDNRKREQREKALWRSGGICAVCKKPLNGTSAQYAHKIANTKPNRIKYGSLVIDHTLNGEMVCSLACNQSMNIGYNNGAVLCLLADIVMYEIRKHNAKENKNENESL